MNMCKNFLYESRDWVQKKIGIAYFDSHFLKTQALNINSNKISIKKNIAVVIVVHSYYMIR